MAYINLPSMKPVPDDASSETRRQMYEEYEALLRLSNPSHFNSDGTVRRGLFQRIADVFRSKSCRK